MTVESVGKSLRGRRPPGGGAREVRAALVAASGRAARIHRARLLPGAGGSIWG